MLISARSSLTPCSKTSNIRDVEIKNTDVIHPLDNPVHKDGGIAILKGNIAPDGCVVKKGAISKDLMYLKGPAKVYTSEEKVTKAIFNHEIEEGDIVVITVFTECFLLNYSKHINQCEKILPHFLSFHQFLKI